MSVITRVAGAVPDRWFCEMINRTYARFEPEIVPIVDACDPHGTAIDVGAWFGPWTRRLARRVDHVVAFEANPTTAKTLRSCLPGNVALHEVAVSDREGTVTFQASGDGRGSEGMSGITATPTAATITVPCVPLDSLEVTDVRIVKIDVEGHELAVLQGARRLLTTWHPVVVVELEERMGAVAPTLAFMTSLGYVGRVFHERTWKPTDEFDFLAEQASTGAPTSYLGTVARGRRGYVNNVVFAHPQSTWAPWSRHDVASLIDRPAAG